MSKTAEFDDDLEFEIEETPSFFSVIKTMFLLFAFVVFCYFVWQLIKLYNECKQNKKSFLGIDLNAAANPKCVIFTGYL